MAGAQGVKIFQEFWFLFLNPCANDCPAPNEDRSSFGARQADEYRMPNPKRKHRSKPPNQVGAEEKDVSCLW